MRLSPTRRAALGGLALAAPVVTVAASPRAEVYVVGTLYRRHATTPAFDLPTLQALVERIDPQVLVLDVTPTELAERKVHASKIEYPGVLFPLLETRKLRAYPAEPAEPMFSEIVQGIIAARKQAAPEAMALLEAHDKATYDALARHWRTPADVQDDTTRAALAAVSLLEGALIGPVQAQGARRWDRHTADVVERAARENPGRRILVATGIANRGWVMQHLRQSAAINLAQAGPWLSPDPT